MVDQRKILCLHEMNGIMACISISSQQQLIKEVMYPLHKYLDLICNRKL